MDLQWQSDVSAFYLFHGNTVADFFLLKQTYLHIYSLAALGCCCILAFSSCREWGFLPSGGSWTWHWSSLSCLTAQALGCPLSRLRHMGLVAPRHMGSSWTRNETHDACIHKWILKHWTTKEVPLLPISLRYWSFSKTSLTSTNYSIFKLKSLFSPPSLRPIYLTPIFTFLYIWLSLHLKHHLEFL